MKISIIIPVYNCKKYLKDCLDSVLNQTYKKLEIILVDDGSTDGSDVICDQYAEHDQRIVVIHQQNKGVSAARNAGMKFITGDVVSFIDADDTLDEDMYEYLCSLMEKYHAEIVHCGYRHVVGDEIRLVHDTGNIYIQDQQEAIDCLVGGKLFVGSLWNKLYRSELLENISFNEKIKINEDILFNFQVFSRAKISVFADYAKYNYIAHINSSACFVTEDLKKAYDSCEVNRYIYSSLKETKQSAIAAERFIRSLGNYYRACNNKKQKERLKEIRKQIWTLYCDNKTIGTNLKVTALLLKFVPKIYMLIYKIYDRVRKPNWEV